jgi:hypothetical protein
MTNNTAQSDYALLSAELFNAQEALHEFSDTAQTAASRKAAKTRFVAANLAIDASLDASVLWEIADLLADRDNAQNIVHGSSITANDANCEQLQADLSGNALVTAVSQRENAEDEKTLEANYDRVTEFLPAAFQQQRDLFIELSDAEGNKVAGPLAKPIENYSDFAEWFVLRLLVYGYSYLHFREKESIGHFPRFDKATGYVVTNAPDETAAAKYARAMGLAARAEKAGDLDAFKHHKAQAETFKAVIDHHKDIEPGQPTLFPAPLWGQPVTLDKILAAMFPDVKLPDRAAVKEAVWLLNERMTAAEFKGFIEDYAPELLGLVEPVVTTYSDIVRAAKVGAGYDPFLAINTYLDAGRPNRTVKVETLKRRILNTAAVLPNEAHIALGFGKRRADLVALLRDSGIEQSRRGPKKGKRKAA